MDNVLGSDVAQPYWTEHTSTPMSTCPDSMFPTSTRMVDEMEYPQVLDTPPHHTYELVGNTMLDRVVERDCCNSLSPTLDLAWCGTATTVPP